MKKNSYNFYATLLDSFQNLLDAPQLYRKFWGNSENPKFSEEEYVEKTEKEFLDKINRVPIALNEYAHRGTAYNELIDRLIDGEKSSKITYKLDKNIYFVKYNGITFEFPYELTNNLKQHYENSATQMYLKSKIDTQYGTVSLYGYPDYICWNSIEDLKTVKSYNAFKFRKGWQHLVYPYCLHEAGTPVNLFIYRATDLKNIWTEHYNFNYNRDKEKLKLHCESLIRYLESNRSKITDKKIFNG